MAVVCVCVPAISCAFRCRAWCECVPRMQRVRLWCECASIFQHPQVQARGVGAQEVRCGNECQQTCGCARSGLRLLCILIILCSTLQRLDATKLMPGIFKPSLKFLLDSPELEMCDHLNQLRALSSCWQSS
eukprot:1140783-Pelagomonas_calceolata.AAC.2